MDPEKQPLLHQGRSEVRRRTRPLTYEEVQETRHEATWKRTRYCLVFMFWSIMAMFLSIITCLLVSAPKCNSIDRVGSAVPPVHLSFAPLLARVINADPL